MKKQQIIIDIKQLEPLDELDEYESDLYSEIQKGNFILRSDEKTKQKYAEIFKFNNQRVI